MDLHRTTFKMESTSYLPNPLASPTLMVLASTAEASRDASIPCQPSRPFGIPISMDKDAHSYTFASMYHRPASVPSGFPSRDFPHSLLHLHPQFAPSALDCSPIGMLSHGAVGAFRPFEDRDGGGYQSAFTPAKRLKVCLEAETSPHLRYTDSEGKEYDFGGTQITSSSPASLKGSDDGAKRIFSLSSMLADQEVSPSSEEQSEHYKKKATLYDTQAPVCPICQILLRPSEMQEHMAQEMERLTQLHLSKISVHKKNMAPGISKGLRTFSVQVKHEGDSPLSCPLSSEDVHQSDRYQTFLRVRTNRQTRLNARIGKMKRRKPEDGQKDGICGGEEETLELYGDNGTHVEEYEWCGLKRVRMATRLERAYRGSVFVTCSTKENHDSDADLDVDGDDTLEYGKAQYTDADIISCSTNEPGELREQDTLRGSLLNASTPPSRITSEFSKRASDEVPSTSNGEGGKLDPCTVTTQETCKHSETQSPEDSARTTLEALKARIRDLEKQLSRGDRYKCLICMDCYTVPLTSIQCWHVHCEECWLRTLGAKKLCPQCNTITSPGDLRRVYL